MSLIASNPRLHFSQGFTFPAVDKIPALGSYPPLPSMTERAFRANLNGLVRVLVRIDEKGEASDVLLVSQAGYGMDWKAVLWAFSLRGEPAKDGGLPVPVWTVIDLTFGFTGRGLDLPHERIP